MVDDDPVARTLIGRLLHAQGYGVHFATDAYTAVTAAREQQPDVILLDFRLPGGDALVVMQRLRQFPKLSFVPIVIVSAADPSTHGLPALAEGAMSFVSKPFEPEELLLAVAQALSRQVDPGVASGSVFKNPAA